MMNSRQELVNFIIQRLLQIERDKGVQSSVFGENTSLMNGSVDSLDLAALVVELQQATNRDPFRNGLVAFDSVGDLAGLYAS